MVSNVPRRSSVLVLPFARDTSRGRLPCRLSGRPLSLLHICSATTDTASTIMQQDEAQRTILGRVSFENGEETKTATTSAHAPSTSDASGVQGVPMGYAASNFDLGDPHLQDNAFRQPMSTSGIQANEHGPPLVSVTATNNVSTAFRGTALPIAESPGSGSTGHILHPPLRSAPPFTSTGYHTTASFGLHAVLKPPTPTHPPPRRPAATR